MLTSYSSRSSSTRSLSLAPRFLDYGFSFRLLPDADMPRLLFFPSGRRDELSYSLSLWTISRLGVSKPCFGGVLKPYCCLGELKRTFLGGVLQF
jgi:hypothetical protein